MKNHHKGSDEPAVTPAAIKMARMYPCGWVYLIEGAWGRPEKPPVEAIVGAWRVDARGNVVARDYVSNHLHKPCGGLPLDAWGVPAMAWPPECTDAVVLPESEANILH